MPTRRSTRSRTKMKEVTKESTSKTKSKKTSKKEKESEKTVKKTSKKAKVDFNKYNFKYITKEGLDLAYLELLEKNTNITKTTNMLDKIIKNKTKSKSMAAGIFEATLLKCIENNPAPVIALSIYDELCATMVDNLNHMSKVGNYMLLIKVNAGKFDPYDIPFMSPDEIFKENWELQDRKKLYAQKKQNEIEMTDAFTCFKCGEKKCKVQQMQTRAADEPMTNIITCTVCGNIFYK